MKNRSNVQIKDKEMTMRKKRKSSLSANLKPRRSRKKRRSKNNNKLNQTKIKKNMNLKSWTTLMDLLTPIKLHTTKCPRQSSKLIRRK